MAQKIVTVFTDDLTGEESQDVAEHTFSLDGVSYEIDLTPDTYDQLLEALGPFLKAGRKSGGGKRGSRKTAPGKKADGPSAAQIREWAQANGFKVNERGRVPAEVRSAYEARREE
ncbi:histone-like nucleoid-structuring protein Lsr2 [Streptomyces lavendulocolor]|uniref:histone-like nucleoid-structuring protein Lsr2 n=1 Tax=Streptomyces lavendulocolor TaxID=67316 RepID=UPI00340C39A0